ncbi:putative ribonuclease H-like domain-containing protein, partial [Tanacetum coccineum]
FSLLNGTQESDSSSGRSKLDKSNARGASTISTSKGYTQEEGIGYDEVFAPIARIEAIKLFLAYASFMGFIMYHIDVKSAFLYGTIDEEVYVCQPPSFEDPQFPDKVYKVEKALYGLHQAPIAWYETLSTYFIENRFKRGIIDKTLFIKKDKGDILLVHVYVDDIIFGSTKNSLCDEFEDKYVADILKKFDFATVKTASTPMEFNKALIKDEEADSVDVHLYRSMIGSLMYLIASRPDIIFLKGQPKLGLWYPKDSPFDLEAFSDSDYAGAIANSTTEAEYVVATNCCGHVLWIQNQMLDYGFNFMNTKIYIHNESTICIAKNPVFHSKTKHIEIRHHFIRDCYEKKLIQVIKIHTYHNVADLLTKAFVVSREENAEFHQIVDFLSTCSINYALTVSPTIYASYIEQFWNTTTSKIVNSVKQIHAIVDGKAVVISESSVRSDLLFNDEDGIACLRNDEIFENLALIGYEQLSIKLTFQKDSFLPQWKFLIHTILHCIISK